MKYIFMDTSRNVVLGQVCTGELFQNFVWTTNHDLAARITFFIDEMLEASKHDISSFDFFAVCSGPGSLTGLRIGFAFFRTLAELTAKPIVGIDLFSWTIESLNIEKQRGNFRLLVQAFLDHVFAVEVMLPETDPIAQPTPKLLRFKEVFQDNNFTNLGVRWQKEGISEVLPSPVALHNLLMRCKELKKDFNSILETKPFYIVPSQAELNFEKRCSHVNVRD